MKTHGEPGGARRPFRGFLRVLALAAAGLAFGAAGARTQELAPRAYWPSPAGTNVLVTGYQRTWGDVVTDPSLPLTGVDSEINYAQLSYQRTFGLFGRTALIQANVPYTWGTTEGLVEGEYRRRDISAFADARVRLAINLLGAPTLDGPGMQALRASPRTIVGTSLLVQPPTGAYETDRLLNAGTNRWAVKPAVGVIWPIRPKWLIEGEIGTWFFGDNPEFLGSTREQRPIVSSEVHLIRRFRPGFWASLDVNYYVGGQTTVGDDIKEDLQRNSRIGATVLVPFRQRHALRFAWSTGAVTKSGGDFDAASINYIFAWR